MKHAYNATPPDIRNRIRHWRKERGHSLEDLAGMVQTSRQSLQMYETGGRDVPLGMLFAIAKALDVPPTHLIVDDQPAAATLDEDEARLIELWRGATAQTRQSLLILLGNPLN